jgi:hypothetical protein
MSKPNKKKVVLSLSHTAAETLLRELDMNLDEAEGCDFPGVEKPARRLRGYGSGRMTDYFSKENLARVEKESALRAVWVAAYNALRLADAQDVRRMADMAIQAHETDTALGEVAYYPEGDQ